MSVEVQTESQPDAVTTSVAASALNLTKVYGEGTSACVRAVDQVSVNFHRGTMTAIMGPSGSGKSTLMHCLAGLDTVTSGRVFLGGHELSAMNDNQLTTVRAASTSTASRPTRGCGGRT